MLLRDDLRFAWTQLWQWRYILGVILATILLGIMAFVFLKVPNAVPIWVGVLSAFGMMIGFAMLGYACALDRCYDAVRTSYEDDNGPRVAKLARLMCLIGSVGAVIAFLSLWWVRVTADRGLGLVIERTPFQPSFWMPVLLVMVVGVVAAGPLYRFGYDRRRRRST